MWLRLLPSFSFSLEKLVNFDTLNRITLVVNARAACDDMIEMYVIIVTIGFGL